MVEHKQRGEWRMVLKIEMFKPHFLEIWSGSIDAGDTETIEYTFEDNLTIVRLFIWASDGSDLYDVVMTLRIEDEYITHDSIPCQMFNTNYHRAPVLNWNVVNGNKLNLSITNNKTSAISLRVFVEVVK